jgi:hypothetical protein
MGFRRLIISLTVASLFTMASFGNAMAGTPFKTIRVVVNPNGTLFLAGAGLTVTHPSTGHYHVAFPSATWNTIISNLTTPCFFIPQVQTLFTTSTAEITGYSTLGDGSGSIDVAVQSGADAMLAMVFTSANC